MLESMSWWLEIVVRVWIRVGVMVEVRARLY